MAELVSWPNIVWKVHNYRSVHNKPSPTQSLRGLKWRLKLTNHFDAHGQKFQLLLEKLCTSQSRSKLKFTIDTCIIGSRGNWFLPSTISYNFQYMECCIWSEPFERICEIICVDKDLTFLIMIKPTGKSKEDYLVQLNESTEISPCVENLCEDIGRLFISGEASDFILKCGNSNFPVHKVILTARSDYFAAMFHSNLKESLEGSAEFQTFQPDALKKVIWYMYTGKIPDLSADSIGKIYAIADIFELEPLKLKCNSFFKEMGTKNVENDSEEAIVRAKASEAVTEDNKKNLEKLNSEELEKIEVAKEQQLLKRLFLSKEWEILSLECPQLAHEMCRPLLLRKCILNH